MPQLTDEERVSIPLTKREIDLIISCIQVARTEDDHEEPDFLISRLRSYLPYFPQEPKRD